MVNGNYLATHLTEHEKDIYEVGALAGEAKWTAMS